jgi:cell division protein FtsQ
MIRKIIHITLIVVLLASTMVLLGFATRNNQLATCDRVSIYIDQQYGNRFIEASDIETTINERIGDLVGKPLEHGSLNKIKQLVEGNPYVSRAAIYRSIEGDLHIRVKQQQPLIRIINNKNQSYYISQTGKLLPVSRKYSARVMVATGNIQAGYSQTTDLTKTDDPGSNTPGEQQLRDLFLLAKTIDQSPFWRSMIDQIYITHNRQFELTPMNGAHIIEFGGLEDMEEKFAKLKLFYYVGLREVGWNYYNRINLKYDRQVVCSK